jgi:hypothetical protein
MKLVWIIFAAIAVVVCVVVLIFMLVNREAEDESPSSGMVSSVPPPPLPPVEEGRESPKTPILPVARGVAKLGSPFTPEIVRESLARQGKGVSWDAELTEKHQVAVMSSIGEAVAETLRNRAARREPAPGFDSIGGPWSSLEEDYLNRWGLSGNVGPPTRDEAAGLARHRANAGIMYPKSGYETAEYYVMSLPWRSPGSEPVNDMFHAGYACRKADGLVFAWTLPQVNRDEILAERGIDAEADRANREAWMAEQREQARERARRALEARSKESGR